MTIIEIEFTFSADYQPDPTNFWDWLLFSILILVTLFLVGSTIVLFRLRKHNVAVRSKHVQTAAILVGAGLVNCWGTFVTNEHLDIFDTMRFVECTLWAFWIQYLLGLDVWFVALTNRILVYGFVFHHRLNIMTPLNRRLFRWILLSILFLPMLLICIVDTAVRGSSYNTTYDTCFTELSFKIAVLLWIIGCCLTLYILNRTISKDSVTYGHFSEYAPYNSIVKVGFCIIVIKTPLNFFGLIGHDYGRLIDTSAIIFFHLYVFLRLMGKTLWMGVTGNEEYLREVISPFAAVTINKGATIQSYMGNAAIVDEFLNFCRSLDESYNVVTDDQKKVRIVWPINAVDAYRKMVAWNRMSDGSRDRDTACTIITDYCDPDSNKYCGVTMNTSKTVARDLIYGRSNLFVAAVQQIIGTLDKKYAQRFFNQHGDRLGVDATEMKELRQRLIANDILNELDIESSSVAEQPETIHHE